MGPHGLNLGHVSMDHQLYPMWDLYCPYGNAEGLCHKGIEWEKHREHLGHYKEVSCELQYGLNIEFWTHIGTLQAGIYGAGQQGYYMINTWASACVWKLLGCPIKIPCGKKLGQRMCVLTQHMGLIWNGSSLSGPHNVGVVWVDPYSVLVDGRGSQLLQGTILLTDLGGKQNIHQAVADYIWNIKHSRLNNNYREIYLPQTKNQTFFVFIVKKDNNFLY